MTNHRIAKALEVTGMVQGVGFRPFVYKLAKAHHIAGDIANTPAGVTIHAEGIQKNIISFCRDLTKKRPPLAIITKISSHAAALQGLDAFRIRKSERTGSFSALIPPDVAVCDDCLGELFDPHNRRYLYPFINCTNCGPRYTITGNIPYDRPATSMHVFKMCDKCRAEYDDPTDRRFHAQPNACDECGPHVWLMDNRRRNIRSKNPVEQAAFLLKKGHVVAVKGLGGFHLAADATNHDAVRRLRKGKHREEKPFALMSYGLDEIGAYARYHEEDKALLVSPRRPIVILRKKRSHPISEFVAPRNKYFGVMLPSTPLHYLLLRRYFTALVMTSGNIQNEPISIENEDALKRLSSIADYFLFNDRDIYCRNDDSIVQMAAGKARLLRRARGYVPAPVWLKNEVPHILGCGAEQKNTVCLAKGRTAFLSQHIGDLKGMDTLEFFKSTVSHMTDLIQVNPEIIACDLHPDYLSSRYARNQTDDAHRIEVQHHHAHIASCMAENRINGPVIGLAFDGTGYGTDGHIWGGEVLIADQKEFKRKAHLAYVRMPGGTAAVKEPWRMAVSYVYEAMGDVCGELNLPVFQRDEPKAVDMITEMIKKNVNSPNTSSMGRLFDGVSAILGIRGVGSYDGQAAMELEMTAGSLPEEMYAYEWTREEVRIIPTGPIITGVVHDMKRGLRRSYISAKFHATLIHLFTRLCDEIRAESHINQVALSGGVFQNHILLTGLIRALVRERFQVHTHCLVPANDAGISLGQVVISAALAQA